MGKKEFVNRKIIGLSGDGDEIKITIEGNTSMPFWNHALKFEAVIALLSTIDEKDFVDGNTWDSYNEYVSEVIDALHIENFR